MNDLRQQRTPASRPTRFPVCEVLLSSTTWRYHHRIGSSDHYLVTLQQTTHISAYHSSISSHKNATQKSLQAYYAYKKDIFYQYFIRHGKMLRNRPFKFACASLGYSCDKKKARRTMTFHLTWRNHNHQCYNAKLYEYRTYQISACIIHQSLEGGIGSGSLSEHSTY